MMELMLNNMQWKILNNNNNLIIQLLIKRTKETIPNINNSNKYNRLNNNFYH